MPTCRPRGVHVMAAVCVRLRYDYRGIEDPRKKHVFDP